MTVVMDYGQHLYLVVRIDYGVVHLLERSDCGIELLRRHRGEEQSIGVRSLPAEDFERLFSIVGNVSGGDLVRKWTEAGHWRVTEEAKGIIDRVIWLEDTVEWMRERAAQRSPRKAIKKAWRIRHAAKG